MKLTHGLPGKNAASNRWDTEYYIIDHYVLVVRICVVQSFPMG